MFQFQGAGAFKLDHLQPFKPILFNSFTFILGQLDWVSVPEAFKLDHFPTVELIIFQFILASISVPIPAKWPKMKNAQEIGITIPQESESYQHRPNLT